MFKPASRAPAARRAVSSWAGATVQALNSSGSLVGTGTANAGGAYSVSVPPGSNYFIRAQVANLVLKAFVPTVSLTAVNVNPASTAKVLVLANIVGVSSLGELSVDAAAALSAVNIDTVMTQITSSAGAATLAGTLATNIASGYNAGSTTPSVGSADTAVATTVTAVALAVTGGSGTSGGVSADTSGSGTTSGGTATEQCSYIYLNDPRTANQVPEESLVKWTTPIDWATNKPGDTIRHIGGRTYSVGFSSPGTTVYLAVKGSGLCVGDLIASADVLVSSVAHPTTNSGEFVLEVNAKDGATSINYVTVTIAAANEKVTTNVSANGG